MTMAGVDHAYQYSVEVKSRFSLFMDDSVNNEDPDILMSKLQNERVERSKKDKAHVLPIVKVEKKVEKESEAVNKPEKLQNKGHSVQNTKVQKPQAVEGQVDTMEQQEKTADAPVQHFYRGRGGPRGFSRGYRGGRGYGPRPNYGEFHANGNDSTSPRDKTHEPRGRFRPRGNFYRGRAMNTDIRELPAQVGQSNHDTQEGRSDESQSTWNNRSVENEPQMGKSNTTDDEHNAVENQDTSKGEEQKEQQEEAPTYTLEEYKAMRNQGKPAVTLATKGTRKPNDGEDVFANMVAHRKIVEVVEDEFVKVEMEEEEPNKFEINVLYRDEVGSRGRQNRGYGSRGFPRDGRARGRPRMDRGGRGMFRGDARGHRGTPRVIYNDQEFPSLK